MASPSVPDRWTWRRLRAVACPRRSSLRSRLPEQLERAAGRTDGATVFAYRVRPAAMEGGVRRAWPGRLQEKPARPRCPGPSLGSTSMTPLDQMPPASAVGAGPAGSPTSTSPSDRGALHVGKLRASPADSHRHPRIALQASTLDPRGRQEIWFTSRMLTAGLHHRRGGATDREPAKNNIRPVLSPCSPRKARGTANPLLSRRHHDVPTRSWCR
jgi:hypothetical protein